MKPALTLVFVFMSGLLPTIIEYFESWLTPFSPGDRAAG
ncbi:Hypothetical protein A7982_02553 [Minicystis rosea]|nr:Hypothetical protein A7982_02553 [Minicystis rosea]